METRVIQDGHKYYQQIDDQLLLISKEDYEAIIAKNKAKINAQKKANEKRRAMI